MVGREEGSRFLCSQGTLTPWRERLFLMASAILVIFTKNDALSLFKTVNLPNRDPPIGATL